MDHPRTSGRSQVPAILVCAAILLGVPLFLFRSQVHALWCSLSFSQAQLRGYQDLCGGEGLGEPQA
ncbi:MAG: hypothetical protein HY721_29725, partial [Planctomycetes bacterium]|nr:hypothetical protein [Planctomycetota bacterium]